MFNLRKNKKGFTLIELIIVIAIIAILAAIAIPSFVGLTNQANQKVAVANANSICTAINTYNALHPDEELTAEQVGSFTALETALGTETYDFWPHGLTSEQFDDADDYIVYDSNVATVDLTNVD